MHPAINIAKRAALAAGKVIVRYFDNLDKLTVNSKHRNDLVSEVDVQAEQEIIRALRKIYPNHGIKAEESGTTGSDEEYQWVIDPLDGTTNYLHGFPHFSTSIALKHKNRLEVGLIYDPIRQEMFTASRGDGAQLNDHRIRVKNRVNLDGALISTGFAPRQLERLPMFMEIFGALMKQGVQMRRVGSAALDLAYVAAGRFDGFWEFGLNEWDIAAGALLVQEAGGLTGDFSGGHEYLQSGNVVCGNPKIFKALVKTLRPHLAPAAPQPAAATRRAASADNGRRSKESE